jgi:hypothetical protein
MPLPEKIQRYVFGVGHRINDYSSVRLEYLREDPQGSSYSDRLTAQLVVGF